MKTINEAVQFAMTQILLESVDLDAQILTEAQNDRLQRLLKMLKARHFGILSPHRSFAHHDEQPLLKGMREGGDLHIFKGDQTAAKLVGADFRGGSRMGLKAAHNAEAWRQLKAAVHHLGFQPLAAVGAYPEKGGEMGTEAAFVIPGQGRMGVKLTPEMMTNLARRYNQDSFIYSGDETNSAVMLFEVTARGKSGLPTAYGKRTPIGTAETPSDIKGLIARLRQPDGAPDKIYGLTQPARHGENPGKPAATVTPGKGKGTTFT